MDAAEQDGVAACPVAEELEGAQHPLALEAGTLEHPLRRDVRDVDHALHAEEAEIGERPQVAIPAATGDMTTFDPESAIVAANAHATTAATASVANPRPRLDGISQ